MSQFVETSVWRDDLEYVTTPAAKLVVQTKVVVEWLTRLLRIREVPGSILGPETAILTEVFRGCP
jgi:hypothetical protein